MYNAYFLLNPRPFIISLWEIAAGNSESYSCLDFVNGLSML